MVGDGAPPPRGRGGGGGGGGGGREANPEAEERKRRKRVAFDKGIISEAPAKVLTTRLLSPSKTVSKHHGRDILRKSHRKNRFLFSFPGLLSPISGGKIGELKDLGTKNPILYLDFPQGQMKLFGTIVYPKNRYLTLQFSRSGKNVMCEDYFDTMEVTSNVGHGIMAQLEEHRAWKLEIVFSDAWWIGKKHENPEEAHLEFPKELHEAHHAEIDFKSGAGAASEIKQGVNNSGLKYVEQESPKTDLEDGSSECQNNLEDLPDVTPIRHSERTAGKRFQYFFAEASSGDDVIANDVDTFEGEDKKGGMEHLSKDYAPGNIRLYSEEEDCHYSDNIVSPKPPQLLEQDLFWEDEELTSLLSKEQENPLFHSLETDPSLGGARRAAVAELHGGGETITIEIPRLQPLVEDDDIEEFSSTSKDSTGSDDDWTG
ncbi:hypothetical protein TEA_024511 [Camellia sinensis var. sinensis]|uniref:Uncharacterized protein n=1 Tax=Camellia sinensis var. sinensis TaxID=542762 RepID=A0A4S4D0X4_CAMSN|nr:hypothetical protein TEA_024511 [Camellia sinensis var. sinensis]